jgi:hypothetical protein
MPPKATPKNVYVHVPVHLVTALFYALSRYQHQGAPKELYATLDAQKKEMETLWCTDGDYSHDLDGLVLDEPSQRRVHVAMECLFQGDRPRYDALITRFLGLGGNTEWAEGPGGTLPDDIEARQDEEGSSQTLSSETLGHEPEDGSSDLVGAEDSDEAVLDNTGEKEAENIGEVEMKMD